MKFIETGDPHILKTKRGGGLAMVFGGAFIFTGTFIIALSTDVPAGIPWYVPVIFGAVFLAIGIPLTFGRNGVIIDRRKRTMVHWFGLMVPMKKNLYRLDRYDHISIRKDIHHGEKRTYNVYPVSIVSKLDTVRGMIFHEPDDYVVARNEAERFASFLGLPIVDVSSGQEVVRKPGSFDETLRDRLAKNGEWTGSLSPPPQMVSKIHPEGDRLIIEIPPRKLTRVEIKRIVFLVVIGIFSLLVLTGLEHLKNMKAHELILYIPAGVLIISFALRPVLRQAKNSWRVTVDSEFLTVEARGSGRKGTTVMAINELEELLMGDPALGGGERGNISPGRKFLAHMIEGGGRKAITANSDKGTVIFGHGLDERELNYIYQLIRKRITE